MKGGIRRRLFIDVCMPWEPIHTNLWKNLVKAAEVLMFSCVVSA